MARTVKAHEYEEKRKQILDVARRLVYTMGYEQFTIQDILDELKISKGAFYHYFDSKPALLEALLDQLIVEGEHIYRMITADRSTPPLVRLQGFFDAAGRWKTAQKGYLLQILKVWYTDDNALVRQRLEARLVEHIAPLLTELLEQGVEEGSVSTPFPDQAGPIVYTLMLGMGETFARLLLSDMPRQEAYERALRLMHAYNDAFTRVLGIADGAVHLIDPPTLGDWFDVTVADDAGSARPAPAQPQEV